MIRPRFVLTIASGVLAVVLTVSATACSSSSTDETTVAASVESTPLDTNPVDSTATETSASESSASESSVQSTPDSSADQTTPGDTGASTPDTSANATAGDDADASNIDVALNIEGLPLDTPADVIIDKLGEPKSKSAIVEEGATGEFVSTWDWPDSGVSAKMAAASADGPSVVRALTVVPPSSLRTMAGIGIGSSADDARKAYGDQLSSESTPNLLVIGSLYGGILVSIFDGEVTEIFVGAAAE